MLFLVLVYFHLCWYGIRISLHLKRCHLSRKVLNFVVFCQTKFTWARREQLLLNICFLLYCKLGLAEGLNDWFWKLVVSVSKCRMRSCDLSSLLKLGSIINLSDIIVGSIRIWNLRIHCCILGCFKWPQSKLIHIWRYISSLSQFTVHPLLLLHPVVHMLFRGVYRSAQCLFAKRSKSFLAC